MDLYNIQFSSGSGCGLFREALQIEMVRWFGHLEHKGVNNWVLACRNVVVVGVRCAGMHARTMGTRGAAPYKGAAVPFLSNKKK